MMNLVQGDCRCGSLGFAAGEDLSLSSGKLAKLNSGKDLVLPTSASDVTPYVLAVGADTGYLCGAIPLCSAANARVVLSGACDAGDKLVSKGDGRVEKSAEGNAGALLIGIAEEKGVDGQHVLLRPLACGTRGEKGLDGAPGAAGPAGPAGADAGLIYIALGECFNLAPPEPGNLVGAVVVRDSASMTWVWSELGTYGNSPDRAALVVGVSDGSLVCVDLGPVPATAGQTCVTVPAAHVGGGLYAGATVVMCISGASCVLGCFGMEGWVMAYPAYRCAGVCDGKATLVTAPTPV